jgi:hypothetical protein
MDETRTRSCALAELKAMSNEDNTAGELTFTLYRLQIALAMPVSPYREALLRAIERRLQAERGMKRPDAGLDSQRSAAA